MTDQIITIGELADEISKGLPSWQRNGNEVWLRNVHSMLKEGGVWGFPKQGRVFKRAGSGFVEITEELPSTAKEESNEDHRTD